MLQAIIGIGVIAILLTAGFYFTRGGGGVPGGIDDPAREARAQFDEIGNPRIPPGASFEDREHEVE